MLERLRPIFLVAMGGACGAVARYAFGTAFARRVGTVWPWGTLFINLTGCFLISLLTARLSSDSLRYLLPVGFVGAYTTFSTYEFETMRMMQDGQAAAALVYVAASNLLGFGMVLLGDWAGR